MIVTIWSSQFHIFVYSLFVSCRILKCFASASKPHFIVNHILLTLCTNGIAFDRSNDDVTANSFDFERRLGVKTEHRKMCIVCFGRARTFSEHGARVVSRKDQINYCSFITFLV